MRTRLILASASPRRKQLLEEAGYAFEVAPSDIDEPEPEPGVDPRFYVAQLSWRKASAVAARHKNALILAADTVGAVDGLILNKPLDRVDAERMIRLQEGRDSDVFTGVCLYDSEKSVCVRCVQKSVVRFRLLRDAERNAFLDSRRWEGKAGAYGVQDNDPFVTVAEGSFTNVIGLPMEWINNALSGSTLLAK